MDTFLNGLTPKEKDVVVGVVAGLNDRAIARELGIHPQTVKNRLKVVRDKLELQSRTQLAVYALTGYRPKGVVKGGTRA